GVAGYLLAGGKEGRNIAELRAAIEAAVDWEQIPTVTSPEDFGRIKAYLLQEKDAGRALAMEEELYLRFRQAEQLTAPQASLRAQFLTCLRHMEASGLLRSLRFGRFVLLQPEVLDAYASALLIDVSDEPDGLGSIPEDKVREGKFPIPPEERMA